MNYIGDEYSLPIEIVVLDWTDLVLLPRERIHLRECAEASARGYCAACRAAVNVRDNGSVVFEHHQVCPAGNRRSTHISKRVFEVHKRVPRSRSSSEALRYGGRSLKADKAS